MSRRAEGAPASSSRIAIKASLAWASRKYVGGKSGGGWASSRTRLIARKKLNRPGTSRVVGDGRSQRDGITRSELLALLRLVQGKHWRRRPADNRENTAIGSGAPIDLVSGMKHNLIAIRTNRK